uniref:Uncharacterized protein n=1 Tax=Candidatus Kentrum sp. DK TaxID=2126562 RepID=A0A450SJU0_9GAMM|nr:MAG: hypothetical protein BECKDK2373B_GA0170837_104323 [Candidatus Kentron sp. DK]VFJ57758.1 MAG: hypothetical protein BECKDK2373C_GA0170839_106111 [Candidatus Kentron sp. DK]
MPFPFQDIAGCQPGEIFITSDDPHASHFRLSFFCRHCKVNRIPLPILIFATGFGLAIPDSLQKFRLHFLGIIRGYSKHTEEQASLVFSSYYESARDKHAKNGNEGGWGRVQRAPRGHNLFAGGSLHSSPATQYVLLTFGLQLVRVKSKQLSSSGVSGLTYMIVSWDKFRQ